MRIRVDDTALLPDLLGYLSGRQDALVSTLGDDELDVALLGSYNTAAMRTELYLLIRSWEHRRGGRVDFSDVCDEAAAA